MMESEQLGMESEQFGIEHSLCQEQEKLFKHLLGLLGGCPDTTLMESFLQGEENSKSVSELSALILEILIGRESNT